MVPKSQFQINLGLQAADQCSRSVVPCLRLRLLYRAPGQNVTPYLKLDAVVTATIPRPASIRLSHEIKKIFCAWIALWDTVDTTWPKKQRHRLPGGQSYPTGHQASRAWAPGATHVHVVSSLLPNMNPFPAISRSPLVRSESSRIVAADCGETTNVSMSFAA